MSIPKRRFYTNTIESAQNWNEVQLKDVLEKQDYPVEVKPEKLYREIGIRSHGKGIFYKDLISGAEIGKKRVFEIIPNCLIVNIVFAWERAVAKTTDAEIGMIASHRFPMYKVNEKVVNLDFLVRYFTSDQGKRVLELASPGGAGRSRTLGQKDFLNSKIRVPDISEQIRIAKIFDEIDKLISLSEEEIACLKQQKKAVVSDLFSYNDSNNRNPWKLVKLCDFMKRVTRKNVGNQCTLPLTISAQYGLINQNDFFNKTIASKDMSTYYLLKKGEFAYNKSTSKEYSVGAIKRLDLYETGAVSPLYICFELKETSEFGSDFITQYFESDKWHKQVKEIAQTGARNHGLLNVSVKDFFETEHLLPTSVEEQKRITDILECFDSQIGLAQAELNKLEKIKQGLLTDLFV